MLRGSGKEQMSDKKTRQTEIISQHFIFKGWIAGLWLVLTTTQAEVFTFCSVLDYLCICKWGETCVFSLFTYFLFMFCLWPLTAFFGHTAKLVALSLAVELVGVGLAVARLVLHTQAGRGVEGPGGRLPSAGLGLHGQAAHGWGAEGAFTSCHLPPVLITGPVCLTGLGPSFGKSLKYCLEMHA